eukprot:TRINITY_DN5134_c0_g1_i1.p1 TRINITY_DN5134_c0_g1~~TRINITY_DN5134_c0_g1_i1.p1  ORF type:complete len:394 (+),score=62.86 TRINITY_DN5134_c0_g1_i1:54-1235(+)
MATCTECCICCDTLCTAQVGVLLDSNGARACPHYFHLGCAAQLQPFITRGYGLQMEVEDGGDAALTCPMCRVVFASTAPLPSPLAEPEEWLRLVSCGTGTASERELLDALAATCAAPAAELEAVVQGLLPQGGGVTAEGMRCVVGAVRGVLHPANGGVDPSRAIPDITSAKEDWYDHWDVAGRGVLEKSVLVDALVRSFESRRHMTPARRQGIAEAVHQLWPIFVSGTADGITRGEFLAADGFADVITAHLAVPLREQQRRDSDASSSSSSSSSSSFFSASSSAAAPVAQAAALPDVPNEPFPAQDQSVEAQLLEHRSSMSAAYDASRAPNHHHPPLMLVRRGSAAPPARTRTCGFHAVRIIQSLRNLFSGGREAARSDAYTQIFHDVAPAAV